MKTVGIAFLIVIFCILFTGYTIGLFMVQYDSGNLKKKQEELTNKLDSLKERSDQLQDSIDYKQDKLIEATQRISHLGHKLMNEKTLNQELQLNIDQVIFEKENLQEKLVSLNQALNQANDKISTLSEINRQYAEREKSPIKTALYLVCSFGGAILIGRKKWSIKFAPGDDPNAP